MDTRIVIRIGIYFGPLFALALMLLILNVRRFADVRLGLAGILAWTVGAFSVYRTTFAVLWNRRAARLRGLRPERY